MKSAAIFVKTASVTCYHQCSADGKDKNEITIVKNKQTTVCKNFNAKPKHYLGGIFVSFLALSELFFPESKQCEGTKPALFFW